MAIKAIAVRDNYFDSDVAEYTVTRDVWTIGEYLNCPQISFRTVGDAEWMRTKGESEDGYALRSGDITHSQASSIETVLYGSGTISFKCRVEGEVAKKKVWDGLAFCIDGMQQGDLIGDDTWITKTFEVTGSGSHTLTWAYVKDDSGDGDGEDCAWLDEVVWKPTPSTDVTVDVGDGKSVVVPTEWIDRYESIVSDAGGDKAAALQQTAANGRKVWAPPGFRTEHILTANLYKEPKITSGFTMNDVRAQRARRMQVYQKLDECPYIENYIFKKKDYWC